MLRKILLFLLMTGAAFAQTTTYTGTIKDLSNSIVTSGQVTFTLAPPTDSTILGTSRFVPTTIVCTIQAAGTILNQGSSGPCVVTSNTSLLPSGTSYKICVQPSYITPGSCFYDYAVTSSKDISTVLPTLSTGLVNYQGPAGPVGPTGPAGPAGPTGPISSVFGRTTAAITAQTGDYTCSQVTGAICTAATLYYQTVQVAGAGSWAQRPKLNLVGGTRTNISCADNSGNNSTDCTVSVPTVNITGTANDVTGSRAFGTTYQNTGGSVMYVSGYAVVNGSSTSEMTCTIGAVSPTLVVWSNDSNATFSNGHTGFSCMVPSNYYYSITTGGTATFTLTKWVETAIQ